MLAALLLAVPASLAAAAPLAAPAPAPAAPPSSAPADVARRAIARYLQFPAASRMLEVTNYGPSIALSAAYAASTLYSQPWAPALDALLDAYAADASGTVYGVLHGLNMTAAQGYSIGDELGLMPIAYLARAVARGTPYPSGDDWRLAELVADQYVLGWRLRLPDGTVSRHAGSWGPGEPDVNASFLWGDDQFMGTALLCRLAQTPGFPAAKARAYVDAVAAQAVLFAAHVQDPASGLFRHGYNFATRHSSCCRWGRANGWIMMAHAEAVEAIAAVAPAHPQLAEVLRVWRLHVKGVAALHPADGDGRWHQVLDEPTTFLETSVTAMTVYSIATGVARGWLDAGYAAVAKAGWAGVAGAVGADGVVAGICSGTGIGNTVAFYEARPTDYNASDPGLGAVFRAAIAISQCAACQ